LQGDSYTFGPFRLLPSEHLLLRGETPVALAPKTFELLVALVARHGQLMTRDELMQAIWPDSFVEEINLTVNISLLRKTLGEQSDGRQYIATVPKRGYRFDGAVTECGKAGEMQTEAPPSLLIGQPVAADDERQAAPPALIQPPRVRAGRGMTIAALVLIFAVALWIAYRKAAPSRGQSSGAAGGAANTAQTADPRARELYNEGRGLWGKRSAEALQRSVEQRGDCHRSQVRRGVQRTGRCLHPRRLLWE